MAKKSQKKTQKKLEKQIKKLNTATIIFVGIFTARYLGPSNYGLINYANAYGAFFTAFCSGVP